MELLRSSARQMLARTLMNWSEKHQLGRRTASVASWATDINPVRGTVTGAPKHRLIGESLDQQKRMTEAQGPVVRKVPHQQRQRARSKIGSRLENEKAALVGDQMQSRDAVPRMPADPPVSGAALQRAGVERRQRNPLAVHRRRIKCTFADLRRCPR